MQRRIVGYGQDEQGEPIAWLECGHPQHIRHQPPFINRPWTVTPEGREQMLGQTLECVRCGMPPAVWSRLALGDALTAESEIVDITERFAAVYAAAGSPRAMALFKRYDAEHSLHCMATVYFSPAAREAARAFGAVACPAPERVNLELLVGDEACWTDLFCNPGSDCDV
jgi:hypothetical protein